MVRRIAVLALAVLACATLVGTAFAYTDVNSGHPYQSAIADLSDRGVVSGYPDDSFQPDSPVLRAQFAKMIVKALGIDQAGGGEPPFEDLGPALSPDGYPKSYVAAAFAEGIVQGQTQDQFLPFSGLTRAQAITMIVRAAISLNVARMDTPPADYHSALGAFSEVHGPTAALAEYNGLLAGLVGFGPSWDPWAFATRGEVAQMIEDLLSRAATDPPTSTTTVTLPASGVGRVVFDGDSLTAGSGATDPYPTQFRRRWSGSLSWFNFGVGGQRIRDMLADAGRQIDPLYNPAFGRCVVVVWGGTNDIALWRHFPEVVFADIRDYCLGRKDRGFTVVVLTMLPRSDASALPTTEAAREQLNDLLRSNWQEFADALVDVAADPGLGAPGDELNQEYYQSDRVHLNDNGLGTVARLVYQTVSGL
jgi:lysophospholipase L1-like esterase